MSGREHHYTLRLCWPLSEGDATRDYRAYRREHRFAVPGKPELEGSADPAFRGDPERYNPEDMLLYALSSCHMLWYLHLCASHGVVVTGYEDEAEAVMVETAEGGRFTSATLRPRITLEAGDPSLALGLHERAHAACFIAASVNFPVGCEPRIVRTD